MHNDFSVVKWGHDPLNIASGSANVVYLWKYSEANWILLNTIKAHSKKLSDLEWCEHDNSPFFCTSSPDSIINLFDIRDLSKAKSVKKIKYIGGAPKKVKWNRLDPTMIASSHQGLVCIWDLRKPSEPQSRIFAETNDITSLEWSYKKKNVLLTSSGSTKFKLWDINDHNDPFGGGLVGVNIEKACFAPFGHAVAASTKTNGIIQLLNIQEPTIAKRIENYGQATGSSTSDFYFRRCIIDGKAEYQIVSWSTNDHCLRLCAIKPKAMEACGHNITPEQRTRRLSDLLKPPSLSESAGPVKVKMTLDEEFDSLKPIAGMTIDKMDKRERSLDVSFKSGNTSIVSIRITFPTAYPHEAPPAFTIIQNNTGLPDEQVKKEVVDIGDDYVYKRNLNCVDPCLKYLTTRFVQDPILSSLLTKSTENSNKHEKLTKSSSIHEKLQDMGKEYESYTVISGDTVATVSMRHRMDKLEFKRINGIHASRQLQPGDVLIVKKKNTDTLPSSKKTLKKQSELVSPGTLSRKYRNDQIRFQLASQRTPSKQGDLIKSPSENSRFDKSETLSYQEDVIDKEFKMLQFSPAKLAKTQNLASWSSATPSAKVLSGKLKLVLSETKDQFTTYSYINGQYTITHQQFIFEPNIDNKRVQEDGLLAFTLVIDLSKIIEISVTEPMDSNIDETSKSYLFINCEEKQKVSNSESLYFMGKTERVRDICKAAGPWLSQKKEKNLFESLNLDTSITKLPISNDNSLLTIKTSNPHEDSGIGVMLGKSKIINEKEFTLIRGSLPVIFRDKNWKNIYSNYVHGTSYITFYLKCEYSGPTIILIENNHGDVFGGFAPVEWEVHDGFFGTGESFVFSVRPTFACYKWTKGNDYFMRATRECIGMGAGTHGRYAFYIDKDFNWGTSEVSNTYLNRQLTTTNEFSCTNVEVWQFTNEEIEQNL